MEKLARIQNVEELYLFQVEELVKIYEKFLKDNKNLDIELVGAFGLYTQEMQKQMKKSNGIKQIKNYR